LNKEQKILTIIGILSTAFRLFQTIYFTEKLGSPEAWRFYF